MHRIGSLRLVYNEVVEVGLNYRNLTSSDLGIALVVIQVGVTGMKKTSLFIS